MIFVILALDRPFGWPLQQPAHLFPTTSGAEKLLKPKISPIEVQLISSHRHYSPIDLCVRRTANRQGSMRNVWRPLPAVTRRFDGFERRLLRESGVLCSLCEITSLCPCRNKQKRGRDIQSKTKLRPKSLKQNGSQVFHISCRLLQLPRTFSYIRLYRIWI